MSLPTPCMGALGLLIPGHPSPDAQKDRALKRELLSFGFAQKTFPVPERSDRQENQVPMIRA